MKESKIFRNFAVEMDSNRLTNIILALAALALTVLCAWSIAS
jgi:hypothetical protein